MPTLVITRTLNQCRKSADGKVSYRIGKTIANFSSLSHADDYAGDITSGDINELLLRRIIRETLLVQPNLSTPSVFDGRQIRVTIELL